MRGASQLADAVRVTLGPEVSSHPEAMGCADRLQRRVTIAKEFDLPNAEENLGAQVLRQAAEKTDEIVGDGTSASTILAHAIFSDGIRNVVARASASTTSKCTRGSR